MTIPTPVRVSLLVASLALLAGSSCNEETAEAPAEPAAPEVEVEHDVIIVGGGLAGLTAAQELFGQKVLLLEKEPRLGGRVHTKERDGVRYELGAHFAYDPRWLPPGATPSALVETTPRVGFSEGGTTRFAARAIELVDELEGRSTGAIRTTKHGAARRALFGIIHPGDYEEYIFRRRDDFRMTHSTDYRAQGNGELIDALSRSTGAEVQLGATVHRVRDEGGHAVVEFSKEGEAREARAKLVIVTTPANVTTRLLGALAEGSRVARVRYAPGVVVVLGVTGDALEPFSYVVSEDAGVSGIISRATSGMRLLTIYLARDDAEWAAGRGDDAIVDRTVQSIAKMGLGEIRREDVRFADVHRWESLGTIVSPDPYEEWSPRDTRPSPRIILAGDYTHWDRTQLPYGMPAAVASGRRAASDALSALRSADGAQAPGEVAPVTAAEAARLHARLGLPVPKASEWAPLTTCDVFELSETAPSYLGRLEEGSIAPYGLLLLAERDDAIFEHVLASRAGGLWEYSPRYGVTSADSAMALEGLVAAGVERAIVLESLDVISSRFFDAEGGGFTTVERGRAPYWSGPSADATAMIALLMQRVDPERYARPLAASADFLLRSQSEDGTFQGRWFASSAFTTSYAVRFLALLPDVDGRYRGPIEKATGALVALQRADGSVMGSVTDTALLALTLAVTGNHPEALEAARGFLSRALERGVPAGDGLLYYWFEGAGPKAFFTCRDRGRIAKALAQAALRDAPPPPLR